MIVFKTFLKVLYQCKIPIILYTVLLIGFGGFQMTTSDQATSFVASKPDILIINHDTNDGITKSLIEYMENSSHVANIKEDEEAVSDALFYRDVHYIIYIPKDFRRDFLDHKNPEIEVKSTGDYQASLASMTLERYLTVANTYQKIANSEEELIDNIETTLSKEAEVEITSKLDTNQLANATFYYNFSNYAILAGCVYVVCLILSSFKSDKIRKRTIISSMDDKKYNRKLLLSNSLFALALWLFYCLLSFILLGDIMFTVHGVIYMVNSLLFTMCALTLAFLIGNLMNNKEAINGIVNVVALGSSFLCGAFVPMTLLPKSVLNIAHILPSYWYIKTNELLTGIEVFNLKSMQPVIGNMLIMVAFSILFVIITNIVSGRKRKIG